MYVCNNGKSISSSISGKLGTSYTVTSACTAVDGAILRGWRVLDMLGNDLGVTISPGASFSWGWETDIRLSAIWD